MKKMILLYSGAMVLLVAILSLIWIFPSLFKVNTGIQFITVPDGINVTADKKQYTVNYKDTIAINPGTYNLKLSHSDFNSVSQTVTVKKNQVTKVYIALIANNDNGNKLINTTTMESRLEEIGGYQSVNGPKQISEKYPFINKLPITKKYYIITPCSGPSGSQAFGICIKLAMDNSYIRSQAEQDLKDNNIDTSNVPVYFYQGD